MPGDLFQLMSALGSKQRDRTVKGFFTDQHDRRWFAWMDKENMRPKCEFVLADRTGKFVTPPWNPPMTYIKWADEYSTDFEWKFGPLAEEWAGFTAEFYSDAIRLAEAAKLPIPDVGGALDPKLLGLMGPPPLSPEIPLACEAGERWIIGRKDAPVNTHLQTVLNLGRSITSQLAMDAIRARVAKMIELQEAGEDITEMSNLGAATIPGLPVSIPADFGHREPVRGAEFDIPFDPAEVKWPEFSKAAAKQGMSRAEASAAWALHRAELARQAQVAVA